MLEQSFKYLNEIGGTQEIENGQLQKEKKSQYKKGLSTSIPQVIGKIDPTHPRRLDTISQEDSIIPKTEEKDKQQQDFIYDSGKVFEKRPKQRYSSQIKAQEEGFENALKRKVTWVEGNNNSDAFKQLQNVIDQSMPKKNIPKQKPQHNEQHPFSINKVMTNKSIDSNSSISEIEKSDMNITSNQEVCFKLKWFILVFFIMALVIFSSFSTHTFDLTSHHQGKIKKGKKTGKSHNKQIPAKNKSKKSVLL